MSILDLFTRQKLAFPKTYYIELTNHCNLRCSMCNFHSREVAPTQEREKGFMDAGLAKKIIDQIGGLAGEKWVAFHGAGESMLHKSILEILSYASVYSNMNYGFLTNGMLLNDRASNNLLESGLSWICFSIDGTNKETFEKYRIGSDFELVVHNVRQFIDLKNRKGSNIRTKINMTVQEEMKNDVDAFVSFWLDYVDEVFISPHRPISSRRNVLVNPSAVRIPCYMLEEMMVIYWDGKVGLCCEDWFNEGNLGDASRDTIDAIWNGRRFSQVRRLHQKGQFDRISLCRNCDSWYNAVAEQFFDEKLNCMVQKNAWQYTYRRPEPCMR